MNEPLQNVFRERLAGHEMDVPGGAWEQIQGQLAAEAGSQALRESMQRKFQGHELPVDPSAWSNISTQLGHGMAAGTTFGTAWIAAGVGAVVLTAGLLWWNLPDQMPAAALPAAAVLEQPPSTPNPGAPVEGSTLPAERQGTESAPVPPPHQLPPDLRNNTEEQDLTRVAQANPVVRTDAGRVPPTRDMQATANHAAQSEQPIPEPPVENTAHQQATPSNPGRTGPPAGTGQLAMEAPPSPPPADLPPQSMTEATAADPFASEEASGIFIPNVFSPQGDGVNDTLKVVASGYERAQVRVISAKTGNLVFESNNLGHMWTGRLSNGDIAEEGYYRCVVVLTDPNGETRIKTEVVRLYR